MHSPRRKDKMGQQRPALPKGQFALRGRIWVEGHGGTFLGWGRVALMEQIIEQGSITQAARSLGISYRHAWRLISSMNAQAPEPLVIAEVGGRKGGGTVVTEQGLRAIKRFRQSHEALKRFLEKESLKYQPKDRKKRT